MYYNKWLKEVTLVDDTKTSTSEQYRMPICD